MTEKRLNRILGVIFLIVGIVATSTTIRLNNYIRTTAPRDAAQEQCNAKQIEVMKSWLDARAARDGAMNARDDATIIVLDRIIAGQQPVPPEEVRDWRDAVAADRQVRQDVGDLLESHPIPGC